MYVSFHFVCMYVSVDGWMVNYTRPFPNTLSTDLILLPIPQYIIHVCIFFLLCYYFSVNKTPVHTYLLSLPIHRSLCVHLLIDSSILIQVMLIHLLCYQFIFESISTNSLINPSCPKVYPHTHLSIHSCVLIYFLLHQSIGLHLST